MVAAVHSRNVVVQMLETKLVADLIIAGNDFLPAFQESRIAIQLAQANGCHDICHVALIPRPDDVIFPGAGFGFCQGILVLTMQGEQHVELVDFTVLDAFQRSPGAGAAFCRGEVLDSMEPTMTSE